MWDSPEKSKKVEGKLETIQSLEPKELTTKYKNNKSTIYT